MMRNQSFANPDRFCSCLFFIVCVLFISGGCSGIKSGMASVDKNEALKNTATTYWKLRMENRYEDSYKMEDEKGLPSFQDYILKVAAMKKFNIVSHAVKDVHAEENKGRVTVEISFIMPPVTKSFKKSIEDNWVYRNGEWRHVFSP